MSAWLGVVSADHVQRGISLGIAQVMHGKRSGLARLHSGDWLVYYSPKTSMHDGKPLKQFTAIGEVVDDEIWQADEGAFQPFRRRIRYLDDARPAPVASLTLDLTSTPNWGYQLRRGLIPLSDRDLATIREAMTR
jgi:hypothetical protein